MPSKLLSLLTTLLLGSTLAAHAAPAKLSPAKATQYQRLDFSLDVVAQWQSPYDADDISVDLAITTPRGAQLVLPAYFVAGDSQRKSTWQATLTPREPGVYRYKLVVRDDGRLQPTKTQGQFAVGKGTGKGFLSISNPWALQFDDGSPFRGVGENLCWESRDEDDSGFFKTLHEDKRFNYAEMLPKLARNGGNFARIWMIYWNLPLDWQWVNNNRRLRPTTSRFNESGIERMDELMRLAEANGVYLMMTLESHVGLMGEGWEHSSYNAKNGGPAATPAEFFASPAARKRYKDKLRFLVAKWSHSPYIAAWEFFNEVDLVVKEAKAHPIPEASVTDWHREMSDYLRSIDPHGRIITTSVAHKETVGLFDVPNLHINQVHLYNKLETIPALLHDRAARHGKPFVIGEAAYEVNWKRNFNEVADEKKSHYKRQLWYGLFNPTPVLPMTWWWEYFDEHGLTPYLKGVQEVNQRMLKAGGTQLKPVKVDTSTAGLRSFAVEAGRSTFVYLHNPGNAVASTAVKLQVPGAGPMRITAYDPERQQASAFTASLDAVELQAGQDVILQIERGQ